MPSSWRPGLRGMVLCSRRGGDGGSVIEPQNTGSRGARRTRTDARSAVMRSARQVCSAQAGGASGAGGAYGVGVTSGAGVASGAVVARAGSWPRDRTSSRVSWSAPGQGSSPVRRSRQAAPPPRGSGWLRALPPPPAWAPGGVASGIGVGAGVGAGHAYSTP